MARRQLGGRKEVKVATWVCEWRERTRGDQAGEVSSREGLGQEGQLQSSIPVAGEEEERLAVEQRYGIIGRQASKGGGRDLITTIITIICLGLNSPVRSMH